VRRARDNPRRALHSPAAVCARQSSMARPWRRDQQGRNIVARSGAREKEPKVRPRPLRLGRACARVHNCARAVSLYGRVRECERAGAGPRRWPGAATHGMAAQGTKKQNKATTRAVELAATPARESFPSWLEGWHHQLWRRSGAVRASRSPSARRLGHP
jgi:hypothetical protein